MRDDRVARWLEDLADGKGAPQPSRAAIQRWLDARGREALLCAVNLHGWFAIANDEALACRCGQEPYLDGEPCPVCFAREMYELNAAALRPRGRKRSCKKSVGRKPKVGSAES